MNLSDFIDKIVRKEMYRDIRTMISAGTTLPCVMALISYSEVIGAINRVIHGEAEGIVFGPGQSNRNYSSYASLVGKALKEVDPRMVYRAVRGSIVHRYFPDRQFTIIVNSQDPYSLLNYGNKPSVIVAPDSITFHVNQYFNEMKHAVNKLKRQLKRERNESLELRRSKFQFLIIKS